jgi:hypothetical protein
MDYRLIFVLSLLAGVYIIVVARLRFRTKDNWGKLDKKLLSAAVLLTAFSTWAFLWVSSEVLPKVPTRLADPAFVVGLLALLTSVLCFILTVFTVVCISFVKVTLASYKWSRGEVVCVVAPPATLLILVLTFPFLSVPSGSLVARDGRVLQPGSPYQLYPGKQTAQIGFNKVTKVRTTRKNQDSLEVVFVAYVDIQLQPGNEISADLNQREFEKALNTWFDETLDDHYEIAPRKVCTPCIDDPEWQWIWKCRAPETCEIKNDHTMGPQDTLIGGVHIHWDGTYVTIAL